MGLSLDSFNPVTQISKAKDAATNPAQLYDPRETTKSGTTMFMHGSDPSGIGRYVNNPFKQKDLSESIGDKFKDLFGGGSGDGSQPPGSIFTSLGSDKAQELYGQTQAQTGQDVQGIKKKYEERTTDEYANSQAAKGAQSRYRNISQNLGRNAGAMQGAEAKDQLMRQQLQQEHQNKIAALSDYRSVVSNILSGQGQLELGYRGQELAAQQAPEIQRDWMDPAGIFGRKEGDNNMNMVPGLSELFG